MQFGSFSKMAPARSQRVFHFLASGFQEVGSGLQHASPSSLGFGGANIGSNSLDKNIHSEWPGTGDPSASNQRYRTCVVRKTGLVPLCRRPALLEL